MFWSRGPDYQTEKIKARKLKAQKASFKFTGVKDTDFLILSQLEDRDLFNVCKLNAYTQELCNDQSFWRKRFISKFGEEALKYNYNLWNNKELYLAIVYYLSLAKDDVNKAMEYAAEKGHRDFIDFFIFKGANNWDKGMYGAAKGGHIGLVHFFIDKGANNWSLLLDGGYEAKDPRISRRIIELYELKSGRNFYPVYKHTIREGKVVL
jgi:hypothetical protein